MNRDTEEVIEIGADGLDTESLVQSIQQSVDQKIKDGVYDDARIARAERTNLVHLKNQEDFLHFYMKCLREAVFVDISDFTIRERRSRLAPLLILLKKTIWKLLKFYTYRLWSQQNQINGLMVTAIEGLDEKYTARIDALEQRIKELEEKLETGNP